MSNQENNEPLQEPSPKWRDESPTQSPNRSEPVSIRTCNLCDGSGMASPVYNCTRCNGSGTLPARPQKTPTSKKQSSKIPVLTAALNLIPFPFPFGYAYLHEQGNFTGVILLRLAAVFIGFAVIIFYILGCTSSAECPETEPKIVFGIAALIPIAALGISAVDAYRLANRHD